MAFKKTLWQLFSLTANSILAEQLHKMFHQ